MNGVLIERIQAINGFVAGVQWSLDGTQFACCGGGRGEGVIQVWDVAKRKVMKELRGLSGGFFAVTWHPNGEMLITGDSNGCIRWWNVSSGECVAVRHGHSGAVQSLNVSPDRRLLASSGNDSTLLLWDLESTEHLDTLRRDRPYERLDITDTVGLTEAQKVTLHILGAIEGMPSTVNV
jgi:WD40 repeat protein